MSQLKNLPFGAYVVILIIAMLFILSAFSSKGTGNLIFS